MHNVSVKQLVAIVVMVLVAISGAGVSSAAKASCLLDVTAVAVYAPDHYCAADSYVEEHSEVSCSPYTPARASSITGSISTYSPSWLIFQPYPQLLPERLDKPPRVSLQL